MKDGRAELMGKRSFAGAMTSFPLKASGFDYSVMVANVLAVVFIEGFDLQKLTNTERPMKLDGVPLPNVLVLAHRLSTSRSAMDRY